MRTKLFLTLLLLAFSFIGESQYLSFRNFNHKDGLNTASVNCIAQSSDGYIWLGTDGAELIRYDGKEFKEIEIKNQDNNNHFSSITTEGDKILYSSLFKGYFSYSRKTGDTEKLNQESFNIGHAIGLHHKNGIYYFIGKRGIVYRKGKKYGNLLSLKEQDVKLDVTHSFSTDNAIFLFTNHGKYVLKNGKISDMAEELNISQKLMVPFNFGHFYNQKITLFSSLLNRELEVHIDSKGNYHRPIVSPTNFSLDSDRPVISYFFNTNLNNSITLSKSGEIHIIDKAKIQKIHHNLNKPLQGVQSILSDLNGDFWITSNSNGLYKVSEEPFTKVQFSEELNSKMIFHTLKTKNKKILISTNLNQTHIINPALLNKNKTLNLYTKCSAGEGPNYYLGTNKGVKLYNSKTDELSTVYFPNSIITMLHLEGNELLVGKSNGTLVRVNISSNEVTAFKNKGPVSNFYTSQYNSISKTYYLGTNGGIKTLQKDSEEIITLPLKYSEFGGYCGISTKDIYGTLWFALEKVIIGFTKGGKQVVIDVKKHSNTTLMYTLSSDQLGNLILGTNKGITTIKVNRQGKPIESNIYDVNSGFDGYETNMRSSFQNENVLYVGTVEGLFQVNTGRFVKLPLPLSPIISKVDKEDLSESTTPNSIRLSFKVINSKSSNIYFSYKLKGAGKKSQIINKSSLLLNNLRNGNYTIEVRSSYDGIRFSKPSFYTFKVNAPFWQTNWFIIVLILGIIILNLFVVFFFRSNDASTLINTKDINVHLKLTPHLILFSAVATPIPLLLAPYTDPTLDYHFGLIFSVTFILLTIFFLSLSAKKNGSTHLYDSYLKIALSIVLCLLFWEAFDSQLNPFYTTGVVLVALLAPFIFNRIKLTVVFAIAILAISIGISLVVIDPVFPRTHFIATMFFLVCTLIFTGYLRFDSLEKLIFISSIINKGNIPAIAFTKDGLVTYSSENISTFLGITHDEIINNNIAILNRFIPSGMEQKNKDITKELKDGEKYLVPMENVNGEIQWIEWAYKDFSKNVKVILGQDVTEKIDLENTYELLVQNAEDFIYRCDTAGNYLFLNNVSYEKLGYTKKELIGKSSLRLVHENHVTEVKKYYKEHFETSQDTSYKEFPIRKKNGNIMWIGQYVTTLYSVGSRKYVTGFIALARDITEKRLQQEIIRDQRDSITSSISYARKIQYNLLPQEKMFAESFKEHFIFSKPKDIVSGDFYWLKKVGSHTVLVLSDCTGHGVPGSFMTLLGFNILNTTILEGNTIDPGKILNRLDQKLIEYLPKGEGETTINDGMEIAVCVFDDNSNILSYACAGARFLVYENNSLTMFKGDNKHIGDVEEGFSNYSTNIVELKNDYNLFLFSDGFQDQFGGPRDKKYSFRRLLELFESNINLPLKEQGRIIESDFNYWIGDNSQTDDVTIISVARKVI